MDKQYFDFVVQTSIMLFLILNPLGNIPAYAGIMHEYSSKDYYRIMIRAFEFGNSSDFFVLWREDFGAVAYFDHCVVDFRRDYSF